MKPSILRAQIEILEWVVRLTLTGMPLGMLRYRVLKKQEELEKQLEELSGGGGGDKRGTSIR